MEIDRLTCERALEARDARFDGWFFTAVHSTKIYCRPSCPARTPLLHRVDFYSTSAAAQAAGYRACKRCRPDAVPGSPAWAPRSDVAARAIRLIADGVVEREGVVGLAARLHYSTRHIQRLLVEEVGVGSLELARAERARIARVLLETTDLPMSQVAFGAGFGSLRQFNDTIRDVFADTPSEVRRRRRPEPGSSGVVTLRLAYRRPLNVDSLFGHLVATATPGVEKWDGESLLQAVRLSYGRAFVSLRPAADYVVMRAELDDLRDLTSLVSRVRAELDLDADPVLIAEHLSRSAALQPLVRLAPGRRLPGALDPVAMTLRAVLGQHISTKAAATLAGSLARSLGEPTGREDLTYLFPTPEALTNASDELLAMPAARRATLRAVATALTSGDLDVRPGCDRDAARHQLATIRGVGPWTCGVVAMRALGDPDEPLLGDLGVRRALATLDLGEEDTQQWRPWRSYAVQYLWATSDHPVNQLPPTKETT